MRSPQKSNRARGRGNRKGGGGSNINRVYESAGPEGKVRGTAQQIIEKYLTLARDAQTSGDRVASENFHQHAEHYQRLLAAAMGQQQERRDQAQSDDSDQSDDDGRERQESAQDGGRDSSSGREGNGGRERREEPVRADTGAERHAQNSGGTVSGMQTIDSGEGDDGGDLLVTPEELGSGRTRKRRGGGRRSASSESSETTESAAE